jgi:hypothetical protein
MSKQVLAAQIGIGEVGSELDPQRNVFGHPNVRHWRSDWSSVFAPFDAFSNFSVAVRSSRSATLARRPDRRPLVGSRRRRRPVRWSANRPPWIVKRDRLEVLLESTLRQLLAEKVAQIAEAFRYILRVLLESWSSMPLSCGIPSSAAGVVPS